MKPASDVIAGAVARAASQGTIHPLDTLKVQLQSGKGRRPNLSKIGQLVPPSGTGHVNIAFHIDCVFGCLDKTNPVALVLNMTFAASPQGVCSSVPRVFWRMAYLLPLGSCQLT